jgi:hypothetical protein
MKKCLPCFLALTSFLLISSASFAQTFAILTDDDSMFLYSVGTPPGARMGFTGMTAGQRPVAIDYRPATSELYLMGYNSSNGSTELYRVNTSNGAATSVGAAVTLALGTGSIGFDFNPTVDRIRVVGANKSNYRLNPNNGSIAATDANLSYASGDANAAAQPSVGAAAYTNSYPGLSTTTLYVYDESLNVLGTLASPNTGVINTVGSSGITVNTSNRTTDMDIWFNPANKTNTAFFVANTGSSNLDNLYSLNLATGAATPLGPGTGTAVKDIAVAPAALNNTTPLTGPLVYALAGTGKLLVSFDAKNPEQIRTLVPITGTDSTHTLVGLDFRPADGALYALGYTMGSSPNTYKLYTINPATGAATAINSGTDTLALGNTMEIGFDFNPTVDRIRVVSAQTGANYRLNPSTGLVAATDNNLQWAAGDVNAGKNVRVSTVAYTNSYPNNTTTTALNGINDSGMVFVSINPPNNGQLNTVLSTIFGATTMTGTTDLDYFYDSTTTSNVGYLAANTGSATMDMLYTISATGTPTLVDTIGYGMAVTDIAVMPQFKNVGVSVKGMNAVAPAVYPNPAGNTIQAMLPSAMTKATGYKVVDITGREVAGGSIAASARKAEISLISIPAGVYILHMDGYAPVRFSKL